MPRIAGLIEVIQQPVYDKNTLATGLNFLHTYFQLPVGATPPGSTSPKTFVDTNMDQGGSFPYPKNFEAHAMRLIVQYGASVANLNNIFDFSWVRLFIGTKDYSVTNAFLLTAGVGLSGVAAGTTNVISAQNGRGDQRGIYVLAEPIALIPQQNFRMELRFPQGCFISGSSVDIWLYLDGFFKREVH